MSIITSLLDTDLYKITMLYAVWRTCQRLGIKIPYVTYSFKCRNDKNLIPFKKQIEEEIKNFQSLKFKSDEINYLLSLGYFDFNFGFFLQSLDLNEVNVNIYTKGNKLNIDISGQWIPAILFETPVLAIVNQIYFLETNPILSSRGQIQLDNFILGIKNANCRFVDFGTRRRYSKQWHEKCLLDADKNHVLAGTSNIFYARKLGMNPVGTMAHEWLQAFQALSNDIKNFQKDAFTHWMLTYRGKLDTALTDILGIDNFLNDWDAFFARNYWCLRHDSGSPFTFIDKVESWYLKNLLPMPRLLFSDGLTDKTVKEILEVVNSKRLTALFGIGTYFTNNVGPEPLQIVIKLAKVNGMDVVKISDSKGKAMTDNETPTHRLLRENFNLYNVGA